MKFKTGLIGVMASGAMATQMWIPVVAHASTSVKYAPTVIEVTGQPTLHPQHVVANDPWSKKPTSWVPVYYLQEALKSIGVTTAWNGDTLNVTSTPSGWKVNVSGAPQTGTPPAGQMQFSIHGNQDEFVRAPKLVANDPASKTPTTYVPVYYANLFLQQRLQMNAIWTGTLWSMTSQLNKYGNEIALINGKGYDVTSTTPNASVQTASGDTLSAWIGVKTASDGYNQFVFFFLNGKYLGTDTANPSIEISSAKAAGNGIAVTYPVYMSNDSFADPTGTPVTITYTWNGSKLVPNKPYPKQFQGSSLASQGQSLITATSYSTAAEAANEIVSIQGVNGVGTGSPTVNLGNGIIAKESAAMGQAQYVWQEGNWTIQVRFYTANSNTTVKQVAENMVAYLHTHMLPFPNSHGVIVVESTDANTTSFQPKTTIAWQEGTKVSELQQTGNPVQALQIVVNNQ